MRKGLHRLDCGQGLGCISGRCRDQILILAAQQAQAAAKDDDGHHNGGDNQQDQAGQLYAGEEHQQDTAEQDQDVPQGNRNRRPDQRQDQRGVGGQAADHLASHDPLEERRAKANDAVKQGPPDVRHHPLAQTGNQIVAQARSQREQGRNPQRSSEILIQQGRVVSIEPVHDPADREGKHQADGRRQHQGQRGQGHKAAVGPEERHQPPERTDLL